MVVWGAMLLWMGFVKSYGELLHARAWLGVFEAGLFPGVNYYLSCWYKRNEFGIRAAIFFSAAAVLSLHSVAHFSQLSGSFGGFLAAVS
jgi:MFS family permease